MPIKRRDFLEKAALFSSAAFLSNKLTSVGKSSPSSSNWEEIRRQFSLRNDRVYLNNGTFGPSPNPVLEEIQYQFKRINITGEYGSTKTSFLEIARHINADVAEIALTHNTTEGNNIMAWGVDLKAGDEVIMTSHEHVGNALPWLNRAKIDGIKLKVFKPGGSADENIEKIESLITNRTRVIAIPHITCTTGLVFPIKEIAEIARENEIITAIDGAHGFGALKLDMKDLGVDMYASCGHKWLLGPAGTAALFISKDIIDKITPIHVGAYSADGFELNEKAQKMDAYSKTGHQFFYGTQGKALFSGMEAAAKFMDQIGMYEVEARIATLNNLLYEGLSNMGPKIQVLTPSEEKSRHCMVSFKHSELGYREMGTIMAKNGFRIRMVPESNVNAVRVSTHIYNSEKEIYAFLKLIEDQIL